MGVNEANDNLISLDETSLQEVDSCTYLDSNTVNNARKQIKMLKLEYKIQEEFS